MATDECPFCGERVYHHCKPTIAGCAWVECRRAKGGCGAVLYPARKLAVVQGQTVAWPDVERGME